MIRFQHGISCYLKFTNKLTSAFSKIPSLSLKDFYMNRQFATSLNPIVTSFENQIIKMANTSEFESLFKHLIEPKEEDLSNINQNVEFISLILLEKIITLQSNKEKIEDLSTIYNLYYSLIFTYLQKFRPESLLLLIHILAREPAANKRIFRIFEFIIMRTAFANILGEDELMQLVEDCDKFYKIIEEDSFLEIFEKIEKILFEKYQKEMKFSPENLSKLVFIYSTHRLGNREFYEKIYRHFMQNFELMVTKEIIIISWCLLNSGHFDKKIVINNKLKEIIENDLEKVDEYYKNLYFYALEKDSLKLSKFNFLFKFLKP